MAQIERVGESTELGEGPHWDVETQSLIFVDIKAPSINRYVPSTKQFTKVKLPGSDPIGFIVPVEGSKDRYLLALGRKIVTLSWDGKSSAVSNIQKLAEVDTSPETIKNRINDGKVDPSGRVWFGTMGNEYEPLKFEENTGSLYSLDKNGDVKKHYSGVTISNGLAWNVGLKKFYYIDSPHRKVFQFDYDIESGTISNQQTVFTLAKHNIPGIPDGQTIDADGNLWVAIFGGSRVIQIDPRKPETLLQTVKIPAKQVTSVAFGGPNLDEIYVTTANIVTEVSEYVFDPSEGNGYTYRITGLGAKGLPAVKVKL